MLAIVGVAIIGMAIGLDWVMIGRQSGFGTKQFMLALSGGAILFSGIALSSRNYQRRISEWFVVGLCALVVAMSADLIFPSHLPAFGIRQLILAVTAFGVLVIALPIAEGAQWRLKEWIRFVVSQQEQMGKFFVLFLQVGLLLVVIRQFDLENRAFSNNIMPLALYGFLIHFLLPFRYRLPFFLLLSLTGILGIFGLLNGVWLIGIGLALIGICHFPLDFPIRVCLLLAAGGGLAVLRAELIDSPWSGAIWPILGSIFMFRLIVYLYDLRHQKTPATFAESLSYFFLLPNIVFPLFPVVDYSTFRRTYYDGDRYQIYQTGIDWMFRGVTQLILYRFVSYYLVIAPEDVTNLNSLIHYLVANFLLYLRVSGQFHLIIGLLHLFGFNLPETHHLYFLASSFTDFWRRINIYWKDFMLKLFYYPAYFRLRKWGNTTSLVLATVYVFVATWFFHAYQWFWLRGAFLLTWPDTLFWGILAVLVIINTLYETKYGRKRTLKTRTWQWGNSVSLTLRTAGTFVVICVLWSLWTSSSLTEWFTLWSIQNTSPESTVAPLPAVLLVGLIGSGKLPNSLTNLKIFSAGLKRSSFMYSAVTTTLSLLLLFVVGTPLISGQLGGKVGELIRSLRVSRLNDRDAALLQRGYYEDLVGVNRFNGELWEIYMKRPGDVAYFDASAAVQPTGNFLEQELKPLVVEVANDGIIFSTNRWAMRDQDYQLTPSPDTYRIALVGASSVMGAGVGDQQTFEWLLEERLNRENNGHMYRQYESLNFGVSDYSPLQELMLLESKVVKFQPNALFYIAHQYDEGVSILHLIERTQAGVKAPYSFLNELLEKADVQQETSQELGIKLLKPFGSQIIHWTYGQIVARTREYGILPVWVLMPTPELDMPEENIAALAEAAEKAGFIVLNLADAYSGEDIRSLWVAEWDHHPNERGHAVFAEKLYQKLREKQVDIPLGVWQ
jgi:D-alanyl-lipoteichoic acid acyltransferase DltB (MBOAT superfamily)